MGRAREQAAAPGVSRLQPARHLADLEGGLSLLERAVAVEPLLQRLPGRDPHDQAEAALSRAEGR